MINLFQNKKYRFIIAIFSIFLLSMVILLRAINASVTYDEACTVLNWVYKLEPLSINNIYEVIMCSSANNHLLNSFLIYICGLITNLKYNDFIIRLPNVIFGILLMFYLAKFYINRKIGLLPFVLMLFNFYQIQFFSLARGYGLALVFNTISLLFFNEFYSSEEFKEKEFLLSLVFITLGVYSNTITLLLVCCYVAFILLKVLFNQNRMCFSKKGMVILLIVIASNIIAGLFHFVIAIKDTALYFTNSYSTFIDYFHNIGMNNVTLIAFAIFIILFFAKEFKNNKINNISKMMFTPMLFLLVFGCIAALFIFKKGMPGTREMIPFYSLYAFSIDETIKLFAKDNERVCKYASIVIIVLSLLNFVSCLNISNVKEVDWEIMKDTKTEVYDAAINNKDIEDDYSGSINYYSIKWYRKQIEYYYNYSVDVKK